MMDAYNLAVCFGPTLLPTPVTTDISNHVYVNRLVEIIILHQEDLFPSGGDIVYEKCIVDEYVPIYLYNFVAEGSVCMQSLYRFRSAVFEIV